MPEILYRATLTKEEREKVLSSFPCYYHCKHVSEQHQDAGKRVLDDILTIIQMAFAEGVRVQIKKIDARPVSIRTRTRIKRLRDWFPEKYRIEHSDKIEFLLDYVKSLAEKAFEKGLRVNLNE